MVDQGLPGNAPREAALRSRRPPERRALLAAAAFSALGLAGGPARAQAEPTALERIKKRGTLVVGVYNDMPPFNEGGKGIDIDLAGALAQQMGLQVSLLPFSAGENMNDDLRSVVWRGHYLGWGPADVLLHVPVDRPLMAENPQVNIFAPYYRERVMIARNLQAVPTMDSLDAFKGRTIAVPGLSLAGWLLIGADSGKYREQLTTKWKDGAEAAQALVRGEVAAAAGHASELESVLAGDARFAIDALPLPRMRDGWVIGCAVKKASTDLAQALQGAMNELAAKGTLKTIFASAKVAWRSP
ncbi:periplasmic component of amino acid ABC-type transporter/signal transduction system [Burkholderiales bacterium JOSHI_001]|nr:periplasmic component of amino acid ABC-type transporter/signal transduction system [Burkholderiales bacterium JOSHI_001]